MPFYHRLYILNTLINKERFLGVEDGKWKALNVDEAILNEYLEIRHRATRSLVGRGDLEDVLKELDIFYNKYYMNYIYITKKQRVLPNNERYRESWLSRILGNVPMKKLFKIMKIAPALKEHLDEPVTVYEIRKALKKIKRTDLNGYESILLQHITGQCIPYIDPGIEKYMRYLLRKIDLIQKTELCGIIRNPSYLIYKIFEYILKDKQYLSYICLPSKKVLQKYDQEWQKICSKLKIKYKPTME